ncbi:MAG: AMP-binding protein [Pseudomonadales bacterium]
MNWNFSEALYQLGKSDIADRPALIHDDQTISYATLIERASGIASWLSSQDLPDGSHVGHYLRNSNVYMETFIATGLAGMSHVNVNFRYVDDELLDLCNGLDIRVLVYDTEFTEVVARIKDRCEQTVAFVEVGGDAPVNDFAIAMESLYAFDSSGFQRRTSSNDLILVATGGTTGLPKGTQWRHEDLWFKMEISMGGGLAELALEQHPSTVDEHIANVASLPQAGPVLPLSPLMHGTGLLIALQALAQGTAVVTTSGARFHAGRTVDMVAKHRVGALVIVGDAFAIPLLEELENRRGQNPLVSLKVIFSSGALLSEDSRAGLQSYNQEMMVMDGLGSTETIGFGIATGEAGVFLPMPTTRVFDDQMREVEPGSDTVGIAYSGGYSPIGYYKEPEKSAETFVEIDGERYVKTGDRCTVREDGMLVLLGRDSTVINTGGEKVYTVEVERVLVDHPLIGDAIVVGLPHSRFGNMVVAVVEGPQLSADTIDVEEIKQFARQHLAGYKVPKHVFTIDSLQRAANGKPDYPFVRDYAAQQLAQASPE